MKSVGKNLLSGFLLLSSLMQGPQAHADVIYDLPNLEEGEAPPVPDRQAPSAPSAPAATEAPAAPSTTSPSTHQAQYQGWTILKKISRRTGGDLFYINLKTALPLLRLEVRLGGRAKVLETTVITEQGRRIKVRELTRTDIIESGRFQLSENLNLTDAVKRIELRMQSYDSEAIVLFSAFSDTAQPDLAVKRAPVETPETVETPEVTKPAPPKVVKPAQPKPQVKPAPAQPAAPPTKPSARRDATLREGDRVLSNGKYSGVVLGPAVNGKIWVRDSDDGKAYERPTNTVVKEVTTDSSGRYYRGVKVVSNKKYPGVVTRVFSNDLIMVRDNDDGKEYSRPRDQIAIISNCLPNGTYCAGTRVLSNNKYLGKISSVVGTDLMVRDDDDGKEYLRSKSTVLLEAPCSKPFCKGDRVISNNQYSGTIVAIFQGGILMIRDNDDGKVYARNRSIVRPR